MTKQSQALPPEIIKAIVEAEGKMLQREVSAYMLRMQARMDPNKYAWINRLLIRGSRG